MTKTLGLIRGTIFETPVVQKDQSPFASTNENFKAFLAD
jgi:hypothetical protein